VIRLPANVAADQPKLVHTTDHKVTRSPFPASAKPRILVVDDDMEIRHVITELLETSGYETMQAASGKQGLEMAELKIPDLILLDVLMPGMDGWTVLTKLQANPKVADIPVIVLSAVGDTDMALSLGGATILHKPVDAGRLTAEIAAELTPLARCYVLLVEDDPDSRTIVTRMLEKEGWQFRSAANGNAALRVLKRGRPVAIILDLKMAGMNGFELLELLQKNPEWADIPVIVVSSIDLTQDMKDYLASRVVAMLRKGQFNREELIDLIRPAVQSCALAEP
jgi:CheY-like chemotaxis protein